MNILFLTYGPTHSGKTTFGATLRKSLGESAKFIHVDNDVADEFIKANYNNLRTDPEVLARRSPTDPDLRLRIPQLVTSYALGEGYSVIATAAHPKAVIRQSYYDIAENHGAKIVLLIFRVSDEEAAERIQKNARNIDILDISPHGGSHFQDLYDKQKDLMEEPTEAEKQRCFKVFEVTPSNVDEIMKASEDLVRNNQET